MRGVRVKHALRATRLLSEAAALRVAMERGPGKQEIFSFARVQYF
jgi:hypothetical protein